MQVQDFKRWHWLVISLVVGLALSYVWSSVEWDETLPTIGQRDFENGLITPYAKLGHLLNVTVMPLGDGAHKVIAQRVVDVRTPGEMKLQKVAFRAAIPYAAGTWRGDGEEHRDVLAFLENAREIAPELNYRYAWFRETWAIFMLWTGASVLLIGGVWPSVISLMVGAGLGLQREPKGPDYDLDRFKAEAEKTSERREPSADEIAHIRQLEEELERKLKAQELGMPIPEDQPAAGAAPAGPMKLDGGPLEATATPQQQEEHDYKGEFYPVDRHLPKK